MGNDLREGRFLGTPIDTAESALLSRKQPKTSRAPRVWEQIVTDERGRRRLHGAFTGGFSAGYFNTVSTKGGFVPRSFKTSRNQRAEETKQAVQDFYDKDELEERAQVDIATQEVYDTFADAHNQRARDRAEKELGDRPIIPGGVISEFIDIVSDSIGRVLESRVVIGVQLLQKMGWRYGKGIGEVFEQDRHFKWGPEASLAQERTAVWNEKPKTNTHGLGFDPFRNSKDFERRKIKIEKSKHSTKRTRGIAFGVGVLEETDTFGEIGDYVDPSQDRQINYYDESDDSEGGRIEAQKRRDPSRRIGTPASIGKESFIPGFSLGIVVPETRTFRLPRVPTHFTASRHAVESSKAFGNTRAEHYTVPTPARPADEKTCQAIDSVAVFVAKGGMMSEELARQEHKDDATYSFLFGGEGSEYYRWKLLDVKVTFQKLGVSCIGLRESPLSADDRGFLRGDERMKESTVRSSAVSRPFIQGVPEVDRERVRTALDSTFVKASSESKLHSSEPKPGLRAPNPKSQAPVEDAEALPVVPQPADLKPARTFIDWHAVPLLYKRFNILDPLKGMPRESERKSNFMTYESALDQPEDKDASLNPQPSSKTPHDGDIDISIPPPVYTEPPLDIFKSIFDASEDEDTKDEEVKREETRVAVKSETSETADNKELCSDLPGDASISGRQRLKILADRSDSEAEIEKKPKKEKHKRRKEETFDESILSGLSTSEFEKLLKTLKKGREKKKRKKALKKRQKTRNEPS